MGKKTVAAMVENAASLQQFEGQEARSLPVAKCGQVLPMAKSFTSATSFMAYFPDSDIMLAVMIIVLSTLLVERLVAGLWQLWQFTLGSTEAMQDRPSRGKPVKKDTKEVKELKAQVEELRALCHRQYEGSQAVFVTNSGRKWHKDFHCHHLRNSEDVWEYEPCVTCARVRVP